MKVYCDYEHTNYNIGGEDPEDPWSRDSTEGDYYVKSVHLSGGMRDEYETPGDETIEVGDTVYVAYVVYTTGDTFGSDGGYHAPLVVTKDVTIANKALDWARNIKDYGHCTQDWAAGMENKPYPCWYGYFEYVDKFAIDTFIVSP